MRTKFALFALMLVALSGRTQSSGTPLREELVEMQRNQGVTLVSTVHLIQITPIDFSRRLAATVRTFSKVSRERCVFSQDGQYVVCPSGGTVEVRGWGDTDSLTIFRPDGTLVQTFGGIRNALPYSWSPDKSRILYIERPTGKKHAGLFVLSTLTGQTESLDATALGGLGIVAHPCWAANNREFVYTVKGSVRIYDFETRKSRQLAKGYWATWSPDGTKIAYRNGSTYYSVDPSGANRKLIVKKRSIRSPLWWSPDSRFVAYTSPIGIRESGSLLEEVRLRVRRLEDGAEDWVFAFSGKTPVGEFQWIAGRGLLAPTN